MPARLFVCTPSRLATFECPRRYRFTYVDDPAPTRGMPWAHNSVGAAAHLALHRWWLLPRSQRVPERGVELIEQNWPAFGFRDDRQSARVCERTADQVVAYLADLDPSDEPVGVERTVATRTRALALSGRVDRIDDRVGDPDGEVVVVDYKTGRRELTEDDAAGSAALALYTLAVRRTLRRDCHRVELHHLPTRRVAAFEHDDASLGRHLERAERTAGEIVAATDALAAGEHPDIAFPPIATSACSWCDFRRHCPEGRDASPEVEPWAGLAPFEQ
ncbi:MAG: PD-(D/E)XK nuclease family protein [Jatrophihabitans sp.]